MHDELEFFFFIFLDCNCSRWTPTERVVSKDFTSLSFLNYERECTLPYKPAFTETKTGSTNTTLSACTNWRRSEVELDPMKCLYVNDKSRFEDSICSSVFVMNCTRDDTSTTLSICQFRFVSEWKLKSSIVIGSELFDNYERTCLNPSNVTEYKRVPNTTLSSCSSFSDNKNNKTSCVFLEQTSSYSPCSIVQTKQCSTDSGHIINVCQNVERACPACSPWAEIPSPPSFNLNMTVKTQSYQRFCPNETVSSKTVHTQCSPSSFNCTQWMRVNSQEKCDHFLNVKLTSSECYAYEKRTCDSFHNDCQFQQLSVCKYVIDGVTCKRPKTEG